MTEQEFKKKLVIRIVAGAVLCGVGACLLLFAISSQLADDFKGGYTYGLIGGLTGAGFMTILKNFIFLKNNTYFKKR